jgi:hypothetical protein
MALLIPALFTHFAYAQSTTQTISGLIRDEASQSPLPGANVILTGTSIGTTTDTAGQFRLSHVPLGRHSLRISYVGYEERTVPDIVVTAGKEVRLNLTLQEGLMLAGVEVTYSRAKDKTQTVNDMAIVSARSFNIDDTRKYAGALGDPSRMAANFAGVVAGNDSRNDIVVRGNSPTGMLWQLEGLNIPNPNHFGSLNSTGGPVSLLNNNNMDKSDFLTSAYPAQYGNALAGVFDIRLRNGNTTKHEAVAQVGFGGFELGVEGPISRKHKSSYLVNYRYSTLGIFQAMGIQFGTGTATPIYQDVNYKFQTALGKKGTLSLFGIAGTSKIDFVGNDVDTSAGGGNLYSSAFINQYPRFATTITGLSYQYQLSAKTGTRLTVGYSTTYEQFRADSISYIDRSIVLPSDEGKLTTGKLSAVWSIVHKFSKKLSLQAGASYDYTHFNIFNRDIEQGTVELIRVNTKSNFGLMQAYTQTKYRVSSRLTIAAGLHAQYLSLNDGAAVEPRINARLAINSRHAIVAGYGLNHQAQSIYTYFIETHDARGTSFTNRSLDFTRSNQFVLGHDWNINTRLRLKTEAYYQFLNSVPVTGRPSSFSAINTGSSFVPSDEDSLVNSGTGTNYGVELTLERFFHGGFYFLVTGSLFDSKYIGSDGMERNTAFNTGYAANVLAGKEFKVGRKGNILLVNLKVTSIGGRYLTPVNEGSSRAAGYLIEDEANAFSDRQPTYFRTDLKVGYRKEYRRSTLELAVDLQNLTNNKNVFSRSYDPRSGKVYFNYQQAFFPVPFVRYTF